MLALVKPLARVFALLGLESASASVLLLPFSLNPAELLPPSVLSAALATSAAVAAATTAPTSSAAFLVASCFCAAATAVSSSGSSAGSAGEKVTTTSTVPCVDSATLSAVGVPGEQCARRISPLPSESFIPILSWSHTANDSGAATSNTLSSSVSSQNGFTVPFLTDVFSFLPPADCTTTYGSDVPPLSAAMRPVARSTRTVTVPAGSSLVLARVNPPTLLLVLPSVRSSRASS